MMDCHDARKHLSRLMLPLDGEPSAELLAAQEHLEDCVGCQTDWEQQLESDRALSHRMTEVDVPMQLADRIRDRIAAGPPRAAVNEGVSPPSRRVWLLAVVAAVMILVLCAPLVMWTFSSPTISLENLLAAIQQQAPGDLDSWAAAPRAEFPAGWSAVPQLATQQQPFRQNRLADVPLNAARFAFRAGNGQTVLGVLWTLAESSVENSAELPSLEGAEVWYGPNGEYLVWSESGTVYVVVLDDHGLHDLRAWLLARRTVT